MPDAASSVVAWAILLGHFGLCLSIYNRLNGVGLSRIVTKILSKLLLAFTLLLPPAAWYTVPGFAGALSGQATGCQPPAAGIGYAIACLAAWPIFGVPWLIFRPIFGREYVDAPVHTEVMDIANVTGMSLGATRRCRLMARLPLNQMHQLSIDRIDLPVAGLPEALSGYRIAHFSDVHLTGQNRPEFTQFVVDRAVAWQPDLITLAGDIIDKETCLDWLPEVFSAATARDGCFFILGNHDTRIRQPERTRRRMSALGWRDVGGRWVNVTLRGQATRIAGNEAPWFPRPDLEPDFDPELFTLLLSHSPDQIGWARERGVNLMLAGHTHGGQGRLPIVGPVLSPSLHGSRYASGSFYRSPTTMHVSRGLSGTHLLRINCRPQLSLLTLRRPAAIGS